MKRQEQKASAKFTRGERGAWEWRASLVNKDSTAIRVTFMNPSDDKNFLVLKLIYDDDCHVVAYTVKFWWGDYQRTVDQWKTNQPYELDEDDIEEIKRIMSRFNKTTGANLFLSFGKHKPKGEGDVNSREGESTSQPAPQERGPEHE